MLAAVHSFLRGARWSLYQDLAADLHPLRYLFWESTRQCNLECRHCGSDCGRDRIQTELESRLFLDVLARIALAYDPRRITLVATGGEPLVRRDLVEILQQAGAIGFRLGLVTNALALTRTIARQLARVGVHSAVVSLDGPRDCHDWLRDRRGSFERACNGIRYLREAGLPIVEAITCVTPRTLAYLDDTLEIVVDLGATHWRVFNIFPAGRARGDPDLLLDADGIRRLVHTMAELRRVGAGRGLAVNLSEEGFLGWDWEGRVRDTPYFCRAGIQIAGILADGSIAACPNLPPSLVQGNVHRDDFVQVWEGRYQRFRDRSWTRRGDCATCRQWKVCRGNSLHLWDEANQRPYWCHYRILHGEKAEAISRSDT